MVKIKKIKKAIKSIKLKPKTKPKTVKTRNDSVNKKEDKKTSRTVSALKKIRASIKIPKLKSKVLKKAKILSVKNKKNIKSQKNPIKSSTQSIKLERSVRNPIIEPRPYSWESKATFNPTAFESNGKVHLIYRAVGEDDVSVLGYASSFNGYHIDERPTHFIYHRYFEAPKTGEPMAIYSSGWGWNGGCEDPRVALIDGVIYMLYVAFDGWSSVRLALTSIPLVDFQKGRWHKWERPVLISPPGEIHKNWVIFPEKINGKFAILHSFYPKILIDYFDSLDHFDGTKFIRSNNTRPVDKSRKWDSWFRGVGPTPIKTKEGWLVLYHAMDHTNPDRYKLGALLLDLKDPTKVLYRCDKPILEPEEHYENHGHKWGVVYSCGAVVKDGRLFVYYGGADKVVCVASIMLDELLEDLKQNKQIKLEEVQIKKDVNLPN